MSYDTGNQDPRRRQRPSGTSRSSRSSRPSRSYTGTRSGSRPQHRTARDSYEYNEGYDPHNHYHTYNINRSNSRPRSRSSYDPNRRPASRSGNRPAGRPGTRSRVSVLSRIGRFFRSLLSNRTRSGSRPGSRPASRSSYPASRRRRKKDQQRLSILILIAFFILIILIFALSRCGKKEEPSQEVSVPVADSPVVDDSSVPLETEPSIPTMEGIANVDSVAAAATYYYTYGTHFNITGTSPNIENVRTVHLVLRCLNHEEDEYSYEMGWSTEGDGIRFESSEMINNGINLEVLPEGDYAWLLKICLRDGSDIYRNIVDETDQEIITYYTITQNDTNREIVMENARDSVHNNEYFGVTIQECELPEGIYDFVVDAGHGGNDGGATDGGYTEAELTLKCAFLLKEDLEALGYKVCLSRDGTESADEWMAFTMYDNPDGRVTKACASRAKFGVSLHLNAVEQDLEVGGLQVYTTARGNYNLAAEIAKEIKTNTNCDYSTSLYNKKTDGVYISCESEYDPTNILGNRDALFMIRELGGVATGAYMAGTDVYAPNVYRNSSQGVEALLLELGYITEEKDREDIANNTEGYAQGICNAIDTIAKQAAFPAAEPVEDASSESSVITVTPETTND